MLIEAGAELVVEEDESRELTDDAVLMVATVSLLRVGVTEMGRRQQGVAPPQAITATV